MTLEKLNSRDHLQFLRKKTAPIVDVIYKKLKEISREMSYEFPYGRTILYHLLNLILNIKKQIIER